jgi:2-keto-4-pentenoate hydratase
VVDAHEIQLINARERLAAGSVVRGHKVGLTSRAIQRMLGVGPTRCVIQLAPKPERLGRA